MTLDDRRFDAVKSNTIYLTIVFSTNELPERFCSSRASFDLHAYICDEHSREKRCMGIKILRKIWDILSNKDKKTKQKKSVAFIYLLLLRNLFYIGSK